jgi:hypothetical protein
MYEGDSLLRPDAAFGEPAVTVFRTPAPAAAIVRSNSQVAAVSATPLDLHAIELSARMMRSAELARLLKAAYSAMVDWLDGIETRERDRFFAASANLSDLEQRQRHWERTGCAQY